MVTYFDLEHSGEEQACCGLQGIGRFPDNSAGKNGKHGALQTLRAFGQPSLSIVEPRATGPRESRQD
jgi:hypothetical protein